MEIKKNILIQNPCYKAGKKISVKGLMLHSVGCPQPNAETFVKKWNNPESSRACVHAFIDGNTGVVYQTLPWNHKAWHCGGNANSTHIGVEMCEPACLKYTGGTSFTCSETETATAVVKRTYDVAVELFAFLCQEYGLNPLEDGVIISHKEGHDRGVASGHGDPDHLWKGLQCEYTMDTFRQAVADAMKNAANALDIKKAEQKEMQKKESADTISGTAVKEGDTVALTADAVYYSGKAMPDWVKRERWIVKSVSGDRAVIDKNVSGTRAICSPVNTGYLRAVSAGTADGQNSIAETATAKQEVKKAAMPQTASNMSISERGVELVAKYEGCRLEAYKCPAGVWTIGYGHTAGVKPGDILPSKEKAKELLREDLAKYATSVNNCVKKGLISFSLNQNQFDALTSFCYNCGAGSLQKLVGGRSAAEVADKMLLYNKGGGKVLAGLTRRREEERALFLKNE